MNNAAFNPSEPLTAPLSELAHYDHRAFDEAYANPRARSERAFQWKSVVLPGVVVGLSAMAFIGWVSRSRSN